MFILSATTALYIGNTSYSKAYVGDVQVWPMSSETYTLYTCIYGDNRGDGSNNNYIELPFHTGGNLKVRFQGEVLYTAGGNILGGVYSADTNDYRFFYTGRNVFLDMGSRRQQKVFAMTGLTDFTISNFKLYDNVTGLNILTGATVADVPTENTFKVNISKLKLTAISAWTDDTLIFAGVPAQRDSDGALGILDTLTNNFYTPLYPEHIYGCEPMPPVSSKYLTFDILSGGTIQLSGNCESAQTIQYRVNNGSWNTMQVYGATAANAINVRAGDVIEWKGNNDVYTIEGGVEWDSLYSTSFKGTAAFNAKNKILSLFYGDNADDYDTFPVIPHNSYFTFEHCGNLFNGSNIINADELILPNTVGDEYTYWAMFAWCTSLLTAPELPATALTLGSYDSMFRGCTSLTTAPELPVSTLTEYCYRDMFKGCTSLNYIKCLATDLTALDCVDEWMSGLSASGTFVKKTGVEWPSGISGIPVGWTVIEE